MNTYPSTSDLLAMLTALKEEDKLDLFDEIKSRYNKSFKLKTNYRKNALTQIRTALKSAL